MIRLPVFLMLGLLLAFTGTLASSYPHSHPQRHLDATICPKGSFSTTGYTPCTLCASGYYSDSSAAVTCRIVPAGYYASLAGYETRATLGPPTSIGATGKDDCPAGSYSEAGSSACTPCTSGYYAHDIRNIKCSQADAGWFASDADGAAKSSAASSHAMCPSGSYSLPGSSACTPCSAGYYASGTANTGCTVCQSGLYAAYVGSSACTPCSTGYYVTSNGETSCSAQAPPGPMPTPAPTQGATITLSLKLAFIGLTQALVAADTSGLINAAVETSVASALDLSSQIVYGTASIDATSWTYSTSAAAFGGLRFLSSNVATASVTVTALSSDITGGSSIDQVSESLNDEATTIASAVEIASGSTVTLLMTASVITPAPTPAPTAPPQSGGGSITSNGGGGGTDNTAIIIGVVVGLGCGFVLLSAIAVTCMRAAKAPLLSGASSSSSGSEGGRSNICNGSRSKRSWVDADEPTTATASATSIELAFVPQMRGGRDEPHTPARC